MGVTATGVVRESDILRKGGMRPGDHLILTKAIGTGVIFAASMRNKAHAHWIRSAIKHMTLTNALASKVFVNTGATAVTDVSGFGLVGEEDRSPSSRSTTTPTNTRAEAFHMCCQNIMSSLYTVLLT